MPGTTSQEPAPAGVPSGSLRIAFFVHSLSYVRFFDPVIRGLLDRGHSVHLLLHRVERANSEEADWVDELSRHPAFRWSAAPPGDQSETFRFAKRLRRAADYLRFLDPRFERAPYLVSRARNRAPATFRRAMDNPRLRRPAVVRCVSRVLEWLDANLPRDRALEQGLSGLEVDLLAVSPHLMPGARHSDYIRSAREVGLPTCLCVASWDNLSSKQFIREIPDLVLVWNDVQRREAIELHDIPEDRIAVTGAQTFDRWFGWPPRTREEFCALVGLDPARPFLTYVGGALAPGTPTEAEWARSWVGRLRSCRHPSLRSVQVLVRPHPKRLQEWLAAGFVDDPPPDVHIWPRADASMPISAGSQADYFDSLYHSAAVVGLNTSAMIEAAIAGRTVHTVLAAEFESSQRGTFHFDYLSEVGGGMLQVAESYEEHFDGLDRVLHEPSSSPGRSATAFLGEFIRPHGLDRPATPYVLDALERAAALPVVPRRPRPLSEAAVLVVLWGYRLRRLRSLPARTRRVGRRIRRLYRRARNLASRLRAHALSRRSA